MGSGRLGYIFLGVEILLMYQPIVDAARPKPHRKRLDVNATNSGRGALSMDPYMCGSVLEDAIDIKAVPCPNKTDKAFIPRYTNQSSKTLPKGQNDNVLPSETVASPDCCCCNNGTKNETVNETDDQDEEESPDAAIEETFSLPLDLVASAQQNRSVLFGEYDEPLAMQLQMLLSIAMCHKDHINDWDCGIDCNRTRDFYRHENTYYDKKRDTQFIQGSLRHRPGKPLVFAFRGSTSSPRLWINNLDSRIENPFRDIKEIGLHSGFYGNAKWAWPFVKKIVDSTGNERPIVLAGYSMGGAMAYITGLLLMRQGFAKRLVFYTYGSARPGNNEFAQYFAQMAGDRSFRIVHASDLVPHLTLHKVLFHVPREIWYGPQKEFAAGDYQLCDGSGEDPLCSDGAEEYSIDDHFHYLGRSMSRASCRVKPTTIKAKLWRMLG
ncbi:hypothetical protein AAMO2058_000794300 [Amorphochlora amoebiformis]